MSNVSVGNIVPFPDHSTCRVPTQKAKQPAKPRPKRRCVRIDEGVDSETGKRIRKSFYGKTLKEARQKRDDYLAARKNGSSLADQEQTVSSWVETWQETYIGDVSHSSRTTYEINCQKIIKAIGALRMCDVREVDISKFAKSVSHYKKSTVRKIRITIDQIFRRAVANRIVDVNPCAEVVWSHAGEGTHRYLSQDEILAITRNWREHTAGLWAMVMLWSGLRRGEALALRWSDVDLDAGVIHVLTAMHFEVNTPVIGSPKTESSIRDVPILPPLREALESVTRISDYVCCSKTGKLVTQSIWASGWRAYCNTMTNIINGDTSQPISPGRRADLDEKKDAPREVFKIRAHDLRHTYASMLYDAGVDVKTAQKLLGHSSPEITMRIYTHLSEMRQTASIEKMVQFSEKLLTRTDGRQMGVSTPQDPL